MSRQTRKERARELLLTLEKGPSLDSNEANYTPKKAEADVRRWLDSWIIPEVKRLIPELKPKPEKP